MTELRVGVCVCNVVDLSALHDKKKTNGTAELLVLGPEWRISQAHVFK